MTGTFQYIKVVILSLIISLFLSNKSFGISDNNNYSDSLRITHLCDSAIIYIDDFKSALDYAKIANTIAISNGKQNYIAISDFTLGVVYYQVSDYNKALFCFNKALNIFIENDNRARVIETVEYISTVYIEKFEYSESIKYSELGLIYSDSIEPSNARAGFYSRLGYCYEGLGMYVNSAEALVNALEIFEANNDSLGISSCLINLGMLFSNNKQWDDALEYNCMALEICTELDEKAGISACLNNIGDIYSSTNKYERALEYFKRSLEIDKELEDTNGIAISLNNIGDSYKELNDTVLAISYYQKCLEIGMTNKYPVVAVVLFNLGEVYYGKRDYELALKYAAESREIAREQNATAQVLDTYELLHKIYSATGSYQLAYDYSLKYQYLFDSTYSITKSKYIQEVKSKYNDKKQKVEISVLKEKSTAESQIRILLFVIIGGVLLLIIVMFIINNIIRRSRRLLKKQKQYYEKLLSESEDFIFILNKNGDAKYVSPSYGRKLGRDVQSRLGESAFKYIHKDDVDDVKKVFNKLVDDKQTVNVEFRVFNAFNQCLNMYATGQNLLDDGLIDGIVINFWDITERKKSEELISKSELKFREIFNAFPDIYLQTDMVGNILEVSPSATLLTGYSREEILNMDPNNFHAMMKDYKNVETLFETKTSINDQDIALKIKNGSVINCSLTAELIYSEDNNVPIGAKAVIRDISGRIKNQKQLYESELRLKESNEAKEKLFSIIAHDLIGPIGTNKSIVDLIVSEVNELRLDEIITLITSLKPSLDSTFSLIENLLSWAKIHQERLKQRPEEILLKKQVTDIVNLMKWQASRKSIKLTIEGSNSVCVVADKNQFDVIIRNLLSNAIKFSNRNSEILISLRNDNKKAQIEIFDSGIGMTHNQIHSVLAGKGSPSQSRGTDNEKGTGFGLIIISEFVKNNNGELHAKSIVGEGTTFTVTFPIKN